MRALNLLQNCFQAVVLLEAQSATGQDPVAALAGSSFHLEKVEGTSITVRFSCVPSFISISVGYLVAEKTDIIDYTDIGAALAASLGGRSLAVSSQGRLVPFVL